MDIVEHIEELPGYRQYEAWIPKSPVVAVDHFTECNAVNILFVERTVFESDVSHQALMRQREAEKELLTEGLYRQHVGSVFRRGSLHEIKKSVAESLEIPIPDGTDGEWNFAEVFTPGGCLYVEIAVAQFSDMELTPFVVAAVYVPRERPLRITSDA